MRIIFDLLSNHAARLDRRTGRLLMFCSALGLTLFAGTTAGALRSGDYADAAAGAVLLIATAAIAAMAWTGLRRPGRRSRPV